MPGTDVSCNLFAAIALWIFRRLTTRQRPPQRTGLRVPELDRQVFTPARHGVAVRREGDRVHFGAMTFQGVPHLSSFHIPESNRGIVAAAGQLLAIGREGDAFQVSG